MTSTLILPNRKSAVAEHPEIVARMTKELEQIIEDDRSTPGAKQENDVPIARGKISRSGEKVIAPTCCEGFGMAVLYRHPNLIV